MWTRVYAFSFFSSLYLDQYLWIVYLLHLGYSPALIGVVYGVVQAGRLALDVPSSLLADRLGNKALLAAGGAAKVVAALMFLLAQQGLGFVLAGALATSLALTLPSGVDLAYVQGLLDGAAEDSGSPHRRFMNYVATQYLSSLIGAALGGAIATHSFTWLYAAETLGSALMLAAALALPALPARRSPDGRAADLRQTLPLLIRGGRRGFWLLGIAAAALWACSSVATDYSQTLLAFLHLRPYIISLAFAGAGVLAWLATLLAGRVRAGVQERLLRWGLWGYPLSAAIRAVASAVPWATGVAVGGIALGRGTGGAVSGLLDRRMLDLAPTELRATALSAVNSLQMGLILALFPLLGLLVQNSGIGSAFAVLALGLALCCPPLLLGLRARAHPLKRAEDA